jgi:hypothetical protein
MVYLHGNSKSIFGNYSWVLFSLPSLLARSLKDTKTLILAKKMEEGSWRGIICTFCFYYEFGSVSGIRCLFLTRTSDPKRNFGELMCTTNLSELALIFLYLFKNKIIFICMIFLATKKVGQHIFPPLCCCCWIRDRGWIKTRIRDKHQGSATLVSVVHTLAQRYRKRSKPNIPH